MIGQEAKPVPATNWTLRYEDVAPRKEGLREALCTLGNGYFATARARQRADTRIQALTRRHTHQ
jgi:trehalose/maltose hydrolase-like predicted phosphorylase